MYYNYKHYHSIVLQGLADGRYRFMVGFFVTVHCISF